MMEKIIYVHISLSGLVLYKLTVSSCSPLCVVAGCLETDTLFLVLLLCIDILEPGSVSSPWSGIVRPH